MASRDLDHLVAQAKENAKAVLEACDQAGVDLLIYCTLRPLAEQARLYRQSRSWPAIKQKIDRLRNGGFHFLAEIVEEVGPCNGRHVTNAGPGESWHNFGEAWDAVPLIGGKPAWSYRHARKEWDAYGECVRRVGMCWAGDWTRFREFPHAQLRPVRNPLKEYGPEEVHELLVRKGLLEK